jgi:hypothetical protein
MSAIAMALIGSVLALTGNKLDLGTSAAHMSVGAKGVMNLARRVDLHLQRDSVAREPVDDYSEGVAKEYDAITRDLPPVPRMFFKSSDLVNLTLLNAYITSPETPESLPPLNTFISQLPYELERFSDNFSSSNDVRTVGV